MRLILDSAQVREAGSRSLSCALSQSSPGLQQKIFGNLSVNRKRDVQDGLAEEWDMQDVQEAQAVIKEVAFVLALQKRIQPPPSIQRQFDKYFISWNAWQNELSKSVRQEFIGLPENLSAEDLALTVRNSKREDLLWALQECDLSLVDAFLAGISATQRKMMVEDLPVTLKKVKRRIDLRYNVIKARQAILNIGQKVLRQ